MKFSDVIGNEHIKNHLRNCIDADKIPHAILISAPKGVSKLPLARATAQYIHCTNRINGDSCGVCPSCLQHQSYNHADTFYIFPVVKKGSKSTNSDDLMPQWREFISKHPNESIEQWLKYLDNENAQPRIYVNESDNIVHKMNLSTYSSRYKVMIIWLPERMQPECANKLLKIIEEPFHDSIFILASDSPKDILQTIYSRTQRIELKRLTTAQIAEYLSKTYSIDMAEATAISAPADGNIIVAEEALTLNNENKEFLDLFMQLMRFAYARDIKGLKKWSENVSALKREKCRRFLNYCSRMLRENFIYNLHINNINYLNRDEESFSRKFSPFINERNVEGIFTQITTAESDIHGNANAKIVLFDLALQIALLIK